MRTTGRPAAHHCGTAAALDVIAGRWKVAILWELDNGVRRFGALRRALDGVTEKVLAAQLRELEADGIVRREVHPETPPRVEYSLTPVGQALNKALDPLGAWADDHLRPAS
ncbi:helix-turn-helix transcriptional regulator [Actinocorallia sp. API 0066]|uniref:winged helix-turn-helix transcriptional regulator n=1 Tax=Actinocorallia sp. API 0066 TaxID=2896846 RepID=UPI001E356B4B|nr:helix-turn-helix domain-containing protein [Actinocorallia sp. API 0066]MCD0452915.1 helix-turn-helix transcriptional regulator [Actinocorallia sp. API 0066]